jgi:uncharacterized protein YaaQ
MRSGCSCWASGSRRSDLVAAGGVWLRQPERPARTSILRRVKLVVGIVYNEDAGAMIDALLERGFRATRLQSSGGFLKKSNATILVGVDEPAVDDVISVIRANSRARTQAVTTPSKGAAGESPTPSPRNIDVRGAIVFVVPIQRVERL